MLASFYFFVGCEVCLVSSLFQIAETYILKVYIHNFFFEKEQNHNVLPLHSTVQGLDSHG